MPNKLALVIEPDPLLHMPSEIVDPSDSKLPGLIEDMHLTMKENNGIGLAAVQVGILKRVIVFDVPMMKGEELIERPLDQSGYMLNPKILTASKEQNEFTEGCLSLPEIRVNVKRPSSVVVKYMTLEGNTHEVRLEPSLLTVCIQHEIDHINGYVITDHVSRLKRAMINKRLLKIRKQLLKKRKASS